MAFHLSTGALENWSERGVWPQEKPHEKPAEFYVANLMSVSFKTVSCFRVISARTAA